eukprot:SM000049S16745  [mRNA]  locus=s49:427660:430897:- [translate_table: standard]
MGDNGKPEDATSADAQVVLALSAGASHSVALLTGDLVCSWGRGEDGQLGHGDANERHLPTIVAGLEGAAISSVTCGADHTTAYSQDTRTVYSWGWGDFGRLGHGNSTDVFYPQPIKLLGGLSIKQIACGDCHCLAITGDGEVHGWGRNQNGQLGLGDTEDSLVPRTLPGFDGVRMKMLSAGAEHTVAVSEDGRLYGWGWGRYGNLGLGDRRDRLLPEEVQSVQEERMEMVACGWRHTIAVASSGAIYTYGWSKYGQLGHGDFEDQLVPTRVAALADKKITKISGGWRHTVAIDSEGKLFAWGWNKFGQVGVGNTDDHNLPQLVTSFADQIHLLSAESIFCFLWMEAHYCLHGTSTPKRIESLSTDGQACRQIERPVSNGSGPSLRLLPHRDAVVPGETMVETMAAEPLPASDASVPNADSQKRVRVA